MKYRSILLFGAPGAGKGTQGKILGAIPQFYHFACGDVFRTLNTETELGRTFLEYSSQGKLVPDELTVRLWHQSIDRAANSGFFRPDRDTLVLDGIPRNPRQAEMLEEAIQVLAVINLVCPNKSQVIQRIQRRAFKENRLDDANLEVIRSRMETYEQQTKPVLDFYPPDRVHAVDATRSPVLVLQSILNIVISGQTPV